jgi:hypothetical protein
LIEIDFFATEGTKRGIQREFERTPYDKSSMRSVYHVRNIDEFRLKSMPPGNYSDYRI